MNGWATCVVGIAYDRHRRLLLAGLPFIVS